MDFSVYEVGTELTLFDLGAAEPAPIATFSIDESSDVRLPAPDSLRA